MAGAMTSRQLADEVTRPRLARISIKHPDVLHLDQLDQVTTLPKPVAGLRPPASCTGCPETPSSKAVHRNLSSALIHQSEFRAGRNPQLFKRFLQADDFSFSQSALFSMCLQQVTFGGARSLAGRGKPDRWSNAGDTVQVAIGDRDMFDNFAVAVSHAIGGDDSILDFAFERGRKAMPYSGKADFELIGVHEVLPWLRYSKLPRQTLIVSQVSRLIWCVDNILSLGPPRAPITRRGCSVYTQANVNSRIGRGPLDSRRSRVVPNLAAYSKWRAHRNFFE
jgi:hypothetical protein